MIINGRYIKFACLLQRNKMSKIFFAKITSKHVMYYVVVVYDNNFYIRSLDIRLRKKIYCHLSIKYNISIHDILW